MTLHSHKIKKTLDFYQSFDALCIDKESISSLFEYSQEKIYYHFTNPLLLLQALSHTSYVNESKIFSTSNETLEFLGDSILGAIVSTILFKKFNNLPEGKLSKLRASMVSEYSLAQIARSLNIEEFVLVGNGEQESILDLDSVLADTLEAILGAVYLDSTFNKTIEIFQCWIQQYEAKFKESFFSTERLDLFDPKSTLQEFTIKKFQSLPEYHSVEIDEQKFNVALVINGIKVDEVVMNSKKKAEKKLATQYLKNNQEEILSCS